MEWIHSVALEALVALFGIILTAIATKLGNVLGKFWKEKNTTSSAREVAKTCVSAVEMMYRDLGGEEKLREAITLSGEMLRRKGVDVTDSELRVFLEAALAELKGAFYTR